jgi:putative spermidine/putrescine transport system substrate-binding protein
MGRPDNQAKLPKYIRYGVTSRDAAAKVDPALMGELPTNPANLGQAFAEDVRFWIDNIDKLTERWNKWAAAK